jgi:hypothetical protein
MTSPTFVAQFADGTRIRMSCLCKDTLDLKRGIVLARAAYDSRHKHQRRAPPITEAHLEASDSGTVLERYTADQIRAAS